MTTSLRVRAPRTRNDSLPTAPTGLRLVITRNEGIVVLRAFGEVDAFNADRFGAQLARLPRPHENIVVDLSPLHFCSVAGIRMLDRLYDRYVAKDVAWVVVAGPRVGRVLELAPTISPLPLRARFDEAIQLLVHRQAS